MPSPFSDYLSALMTAMEQAKSIPSSDPQYPVRPIPFSAPQEVLLFSPHPDDEVITAGLPLRLTRELGWKVTNVAVTLGSKKERRQERLTELSECCRAIGFELIMASSDGFDGVNPEQRVGNFSRWTENVTKIKELIEQRRPKAIFFPHDRDWNRTHVGTHLLVMDALLALDRSLSFHVFETEFWGAMDDPNLMVESSPGDVADLIAALSLHKGEIVRNPYHIRMPAWLIDNVRRGGELVGGQGALVPDFTFATLYRHRIWESGTLRSMEERNKYLARNDTPARLFNQS